MTRHEIGIDLIDIDRIVGVLERHPGRFRERVLTEAEQRYVGRKVERLAGRWAAKEAILKAIGTGWSRGISWTDMEIRNEHGGQPRVLISPPALIGL